MKFIQRIIFFMIFFASLGSGLFAQGIFMTIESDSQGEIQPENFISGHEDQIPLHSVKYNLSYPVKQGSRLAIGGMVSNGIIVKKYLDSTTPLLAQMLFTRDRVKMEILFYRTDDYGGEERYLSYLLENARITSVELDAKDGKNSNKHFEEFNIVFGQLTITHEISGATTTFDFEGRY